MPAVASIAQLAARGGASLMGRQAFAFGISAIGGIALARLLTPSDFGAYAYLLFVQALAKLLVDGGLTATLVRQQEAPTRKDWSSVLTFQILLALVLAGLIVLSTPLALQVFGDIEGFVLASTLAALSVLVAPLLSISYAKLERKLQFERLGMLTLVQPVLFNAIAVAMAFLGLGVAALGAALLLSNLLSLMVTLPFTGRPPVPARHPVGIRERMRFGLPYIGSGLISILKDSVNPLLVATALGAAAAGYVRWGGQVAALSTYLVVALSPMLFALFARLRTDVVRLPKGVSAALFWANAVTAPFALLLTIFIRPLATDLYGNQWVPAIPLFYLLCVTNLISPTTTVLLALMNALGRPRVSLTFALLWFVGTWVLVPLFITPFGLLGYGVANAAIQAIGIALIVVARRKVPFSVLRPLLIPWAVAVLASCPAIFIEWRYPVQSLALVAGLGVTTLLLHVLLLGVFARTETATLRTALRKEA
jgi:O-antigen/teichoic acid export membrane protein